MRPKILFSADLGFVCTGGAMHDKNKNELTTSRLFCTGHFFPWLSNLDVRSCECSGANASFPDFHAERNL